MPLPVPQNGESRDDFIGRCMSASVVQREFPRRRQRLAVCFAQWRKGKARKHSRRGRVRK